MDNSLGTGFMAVFAVSGSVAFLAMHLHKRLLSNFLDKMECEIRNSKGRVKEEPRKKVRFSDDVVVVSTADHGGCRKKYIATVVAGPPHRYVNDENLESMPENWQVMYKGILQCRNLRGFN